jgi:hypothetical protein
MSHLFAINNKFFIVFDYRIQQLYCVKVDNNTYWTYYFKLLIIVHNTGSIPWPIISKNKLK